MKLAVILSHPTQYYSPWFRWLELHTQIEFKVFYLWQFGTTVTFDRQFGKAFSWDIDLLEGYDHEFIPNISHDPGTHHFKGLKNPELVRHLGVFNPSAILIFGYNYSTHLRAILWASLKGIPLIFRGDSHLIGQTSVPVFKKNLLRFLYRRFAAVTFVGQVNRSYFEFFGVPQNRLFFSPHSVNHELFDPTRADVQHAANELRSSLELGTRRVVLFAGKLVSAKQPRELFESFLSSANDNTALVFVGEGSEKQYLEKRSRENPNACVRFLPFANQSEMPARYLLADIFALPSRGKSETWGLAVNEAMHLGVPCLVSDVVGCQRDLVTDGQTGWVFRAAEPAQLTEKLNAALSLSDEKLAEMKLRIRDRISQYTYEHTSNGLEQALRSIEKPTSK